MNKQLAVAAFIAALSFAADAGAHAHAQLNPGGARCNGCHTGGRPPTPGFSPGDNASRVGAGFQITGGKRAQILLDVVTQPNQGLGLAVTVGDGLTIESTRSDMRVERQMLGQNAVIFDRVGVYHIPFVLTAPSSSCGRRFTLSANVAAVDKNGAPNNDGAATTATSVYVDCTAAASAATPTAEVPKIAVNPANSIAASAVAPAVTAPSGAARVMAPTGSITAPVRVSVDALRAPGGVAQLELTSVNRITTAGPPEAEFLDAGGGPAGSISVRFNQAAGHILVDCEVRSPSDVRFTIDAGTLHIENTVPAGDGHAVTVVPRGGVQRDVQVQLRGTGRKWSFRGCELTPVR